MLCCLVYLSYWVCYCHLYQLQNIQNAAAQVLTKTRWRAHITPVLKSLDWFRIDFKIIVLALNPFMVMHPSTSQTGPRGIERQLLVCIPPAFGTACQKIWGAVRVTLGSAKMFKRHLKKYCLSVILAHPFYYTWATCILPLALVTLCCICLFLFYFFLRKRIVLHLCCI